MVNIRFLKEWKFVYSIPLYCNIPLACSNCFILTVFGFFYKQLFKWKISRVNDKYQA